MQVLKYCLLEYGMGSTAGIVKLRQFYQSYCVFIISFLIHTRENVRSSCFLPQQGQRDTGMRLLAKSIHGTRENR